MSSICRKCGKKLPKDRKGSEQVCEECNAKRTAMKVREILGELTGSASMCWVPRPEGIFNSIEAIKFTDQALKELALWVRTRPVVAREGEKINSKYFIMGYRRCEDDIAKSMEEEDGL